LLEQIIEVTGIVDHRLIQKAIADCSDPKGKFQIDEVVNRLLEYDVNPSSSQSLVQKSFWILVMCYCCGKWDWEAIFCN